jgi:hypothetical protein
MDGLDIGWVLAAGGVAVGMVMGAVARLDHFCTLSSLERLWYAGDGHGVRGWVLASAVAIALTQALALSGLLDLSSSFYLSPAFGLTGAILGGLAFGFGMALVGTCGFGALVQLGGGNLRALVVLIVLGLSALAAQRGIVALARVKLVDELAIDLSFAGDQSAGSVASALTGLDLRLAAAAVVVAAMLAWVASDRTFLARPRRLMAALVIGAAIPAGWLVTSWGAAHAFEPVQLEAGSFVVPVGDTLMQFATFTGVLPDYGVGLVLGVGLGAALVAWRRRDVRWEACDDARELGRHIAGAFLMGTGGVFAMGCTIGQGLSAASTLAISAPVAVVSIAAGARLGLAWLIEGSIRNAWRAPHREPAE